MKRGVALASAALIASAGVALADGGDVETDIVMFDAPDGVAMSLEDLGREQRGMAPRFAIPSHTNLSPTNAGRWRKLDADHDAWTLRIGSPGARNINLGFTSFELPAAATLHVASTDGAVEVRPFTAADNNAHGQLWTPVLPTDDLTIELIVPRNQRHKVELVLTSVNLGYRSFGERAGTAGRASGACNVDVACPESVGWEDEIDSVAVISTGGTTFCTGFMVNNVRQDRRPLFMTAYHCGIRSGDAPSLVAYWNFANSTCRPPGSPASGGNGDGVLSDFTTGATLLAEGPASDFTLVELNSSPLEEYEVSYAGWDNRFYEPVGVVGIHHPDTDEMRISFEYDQTTSVPGLTSSPEVPVETSTHLKVPDWDVGTTEPGSSGSPVFDLNTRRVLGQLHGGGAACGNDLYDAYGRIARSWDNGSPGNSLRFHLDPDSTGAEFVDTLPAAGVVVSPAGSFFSYGVVGGPYSGDSVVYTIDNTSPTAIDYRVSLVSGGSLPVLINSGAGPVAGTLPRGGSVNFAVEIAVSAYGLPRGVYQAEVLIEDLTNGTSVSRMHALEVGFTGIEVTPDAGLLAGGPVGGPFSATQTYTITSTRPTTAKLAITASRPWVSINGASGETVVLTSEGGSVDITVGFNAAAETLPAGLAQATLDITNVTDGVGSTTRGITLDVGRFRYAADDVPQPIESNTQITSAVFVPDDVCVADVDVVLDINHTFIGDLRITLESPDGTAVTLHDRSGGNANDLMVEYDGDAFGVDGPGSLNDFIGSAASGLWVLTVADEAGGDTGTLNSWELQIAATGGECPPAAGDVFATTSAGDPVDVRLTATSQGGTGVLTYSIVSLPSRGSLFLPGTVTEITGVPFALPGDAVTYLPDADASGTDTFLYIASDTQDSLPATAGVSVVSGDVIYGFFMDIDPGWIATGDWAWGQPLGIDEDPSSGFTGDNVYGYNLSGEYPNNMSPETLTTRALDLTGVTGATVTFRRWLGVESSTFDAARVEVSNDGSGWTELWSNPASSIREDTWTEVTYDISAVADGESTVFIRWVMGGTDSSLNYAGWNIDDVLIEGTRPPCEGDVNDDRVVDTADLLEMLASFNRSVLPGTSGDIDGDGRVDTADLLALLAGFNQPC